jgi:hypothetical protein
MGQSAEWREHYRTYRAALAEHRDTEKGIVPDDRKWHSPKPLFLYNLFAC